MGTPPNPVVTAIIQGSRTRGLDPNAVLAVARVEGLSGGIGDGGHAYGPFQLNNAGGVITNTRPGTNDPNIQRWATSPEGIGFALDRIAQVAHGLRGRQAVNAIVSRFERPADPNGEMTRAWSNYSGGVSAEPPSVGAPLAAPPRQGGSLGRFSPLIASILSSNDRMLGIESPDFSSFLKSQPIAQAPVPVQAPYKPQAPRVSGKTVKSLEAFAAPYGLTITATTNGTHAKGSYHYQGRAVDFGGDPKRMAALADAALHNAGEWQEFIYTGPGNPGFSILRGQVIPNSQLPKALYQQHENHVHLAR